MEGTEDTNSQLASEVENLKKQLRRFVTNMKDYSETKLLSEQRVSLKSWWEGGLGAVEILVGGRPRGSGNPGGREA